MQEENNVDIGKPERQRSQCFFNVSSFAVITCIIASAFTTYHYPKSQPELIIWGGVPLWATSFAPLIWLFSIIFPLILSIGFLFRHRYKMWHIGSYWMMWVSIALAILFMIMPVIEIIGTALAQLFCSFGTLIGGLFLFVKDINKLYNSCLAQNGVNPNQAFGIAIYLIYAAALISLIALIYMATTKVFKK